MSINVNHYKKEWLRRWNQDSTCSKAIPVSVIQTTNRRHQGENNLIERMMKAAGIL